MEIQHIISKKIAKRKYVAWFRVYELSQDVNELVFKFGIFNKVRFAASELKKEAGSDFHLIQINGISSVLHKFQYCSVNVVKANSVENRVVHNSKKYEDLTGDRTFSNAKQKLEIAFKKN